MQQDLFETNAGAARQENDTSQQHPNTETENGTYHELLPPVGGTHQTDGTGKTSGLARRARLGTVPIRTS